MNIEGAQSQSCCRCILYKLRAAYDKVKEVVIAIFRALFCLNLEGPRKLTCIEAVPSPKLSPRIQLLAELVDMSLYDEEPPIEDSPVRNVTPAKVDTPPRAPSPVTAPIEVPAPIPVQDVYQQVIDEMNVSPPRTSPVRGVSPTLSTSSWVDSVAVLMDRDTPPM